MNIFHLKNPIYANSKVKEPIQLAKYIFYESGVTLVAPKCLESICAVTSTHGEQESNNDIISGRCRS